MKEDRFKELNEGAGRIAYLISGYVRQILSEKELDELDNWITASDANQRLFEELTDEKNIEANLQWMDEVKSSERFEALKKAGKFRLPAKRIRLNPVWVAAASVLLLAGIFAVYQYVLKPKKNPVEIAATTDIEAGGNYAKLRLEDGTVIDLSKAATGELKNFSHVSVFKNADGQLVYEAGETIEPVPAFHTLSTPAGGQFMVRLPDGTQVWLNAESSLTYPVAFDDKERVVELEGEGYFEVAPRPLSPKGGENALSPKGGNGKVPFVVKVNGMEVEVLGTHFNVNAYKNEDAKKVTLLEGKVRVVNREPSIVSRELVPGQQAQLVNGEWKVASGVDTEEAVGWKDGKFVFHDAPIEAIMRQVERWYGAKIEYKGKINDLFNATIERKEPLSKLLHLLELNGYVRFNIENKTVYVYPG